MSPSFSLFKPREPKRILFDVDSEYSPYLMHSIWPVVYEDEEYPSAAHLLHALQFLPKHPEIAKQIRLTKEHRDVEAISAENVALVDPAFYAAVVENVRLSPRFSVPRTPKAFGNTTSYRQRKS